MKDALTIENSKILRSIWKNTYDKILEIKVANKMSLKQIKTNIMEEEKKKIDEKYEKEYQEQFIQNKIDISKARNSSNLERMKLKNELVEKIMEETLEKIKQFADPKNEKYQNLIQDIILESMVKMLETTCYLQIRKEDESFVQSILKNCEEKFHDYMLKETGREYNCQLTIDQDNYIDDEYGGIRLLSKDKKIILNDELKTRLKLSKDLHLPIIKNLLFPKK